MNKPRVFRPTPLPASVRRNARALRRNMTDAERLLWSRLRMGQLGFRFRLQHPIAPYVIDLYCIERRLAIELDGGQHNESAGIASDRHRSARLRTQGIQTLRFWDNDVLNNIDGVLQIILESLGTPPYPSPAGGGSRHRVAGK
jgi:very-short-patch-repair endonuclease